MEASGKLPIFSFGVPHFTASSNSHYRARMVEPDEARTRKESDVDGGGLSRGDEHWVTAAIGKKCWMQTCDRRAARRPRPIDYSRIRCLRAKDAASVRVFALSLARIEET